MLMQKSGNFVKKVHFAKTIVLFGFVGKNVSFIFGWNWLANLSCASKFFV